MKYFFIFLIGIALGASVTAGLILPAEEYKASKATKTEVVKQDSTVAVEPLASPTIDTAAGSVMQHE